MVWRVWFLVWLFKDLVNVWGNGLNSPANHCTPKMDMTIVLHPPAKMDMTIVRVLHPSAKMDMTLANHCTTPISLDGHDLS